MDWHRFSLLQKRVAMKPPPVLELPSLPDPLPVMTTSATAAEQQPETEAADAWQVHRTILTKRKAVSFTNGFRTQHHKSL
jgi:hypothetical protein